MLAFFICRYDYVIRIEKVLEMIYLNEATVQLVRVQHTVLCVSDLKMGGYGSKGRVKAMLESR